MIKDAHPPADEAHCISSPGLAPFSVRASVADGNRIVIFQGFEPDITALDIASRALSLGLKKAGGAASNTIWVFQEAYRAGQTSNPRLHDPVEQAQRVERHDQIVVLCRQYAHSAGLVVENSFLEPRGGCFDTVVVFA